MDGVSTSDARPLILTADPDLLDQLQRLCAAAGVAADVLADVSRVRQPWPRASAVIVGEDLADAVARLALPRRDRVVVVSGARDPSPLWRLAVELKADDVASLPAAQPRLSAWLSDLADGVPSATTVAVIGGCGGAGASTLAVAIALSAARADVAALLVDADPMGGGVELAIGCEDVNGLRWPEVAATRGRVGAAAFRAALPNLGNLAVLSWDRAASGHPNPETMSTMIRAAQRGARIVVVDLPRHLDEPASDALLLSDLLVVVTTTDLRAVASARAMLPGLRQLCADVRLVVRVVPGSDLSAHAVADVLGLTLSGVLPTSRSVARSVNDGLGPYGRGRLERACRPIVDALLSPAVGTR